MNKSCSVALATRIHQESHRLGRYVGSSSFKSVFKTPLIPIIVDNHIPLYSLFKVSERLADIGVFKNMDTVIDCFPALLVKPQQMSIDKLKKGLETWFSSDKYTALRARLLAIEFLRLLKKRVPYSKLSEITGISQSVLCRYVRGSIIPSFSQAINILATLSLSINIDGVIRRFLEKEQSTVLDLSRLLRDPYLIRILSFTLLARLVGKRVDKILVGAPGVLPLATAVALELGTDIVLAKRGMKYPNVSYYEEVVVRSMRDVESIYVDKDLISRRDHVVILTDVVITGKTLKALLNIVARAHAYVVDVITVVAIGDEWRKRIARNIAYLSYLERTFF